jgi:hypothetical protein
MEFLTQGVVYIPTYTSEDLLQLMHGALVKFFFESNLITDVKEPPEKVCSEHQDIFDKVTGMTFQDFAEWLFSRSSNIYVLLLIVQLAPAIRNDLLTMALLRKNESEIDEKFVKFFTEVRGPVVLGAKLELAPHFPVVTVKGAKMHIMIAPKNLHAIGVRDVQFFSEMPVPFFHSLVFNKDVENITKILKYKLPHSTVGVVVPSLIRQMVNVTPNDLAIMAGWEKEFRELMESKDEGVDVEMCGNK